MEKAAAEKVAAEKAAADKLAAEKAAAAGPAEPSKPQQQLASLPPETPPEKPAERPAMSAAEIARAVQAELRRVGCQNGAVDDEWSSSARRSLELFNKNTGMKLDVKLASLDALDAIKARPARVCPLICEHGYKADGERCTKITCRAGFEVGDDNTCERIEVKKPAAKREEPKSKRDWSERAKAEASPQSSGGQILCDSAGCRPARKGCRVEEFPNANGNLHGGRQHEVCN
jgi:hypothetical protein